MPFGRSRVVFVMDRSVLKKLQTWGIGRCAAQWVSMRALREPNAIPWLDPDLAQALGVASARDVEERLEA